MGKPIVVLAFSGGLDTTFCAAWLREQGYDVHTVAVQTGGFDADELATVAARSKAAGAVAHRVIDARQRVFDETLRYLIFANAQRGDVYPLCVSAERLAQASACVTAARDAGAAAIAHGSTGAGNDQVRFDVAFASLAPDLDVMAPVRALAYSRRQSTDWLAQRGIHVPARTSRYSVNRGLWGATIGGGETHASDGVLPDDAYVLTAPHDRRPRTPETVRVEFARGVPSALDGAPLGPVELIESLNDRAGRHGVGRGVHVGDTILGIKGRVAFEAPAAAVLLAAHRELEKLVLSRGQQFWKRTLGELYAALVHEARWFDPLARDLEAFLESSQRDVTGSVRVQLRDGQATVLGATSPRSLLGAGGSYGEGSSSWTGAEAAAFCRLYGLPDRLSEHAWKGGANANLAR